MQGQLQEIDCPSLLRLIAGGQRTGLLWVEAEPRPVPRANPSSALAAAKDHARDIDRSTTRGGAFRRDRAWVLSLVQGQLVYGCPVGEGGDRLGDCLRRLAIAPWPSDAAIARYSGELWAPEYGLLWLLLEQQSINQAQACSLARQLSEETLFEIACLRRGRFQFVASTAIAPQLASFALPALVQRLERKLHHWQRLYPQIDSLHQCPLLRNPDALAVHLPRPALGALHRWADGQTSILRLARHLNRHPVDVARALVPHLGAGHIQLCWAEAQADGPADNSRPVTGAASRPASRENTAALGDPAIAAPPSPYLLWVGSDLATQRPELHLRLTQQLAQWGHHLDQCQQALPALAQALEQPPQVILCEVNLPDQGGGAALSGYDFCRLGRQLAPLGQLPIILLQSGSQPGPSGSDFWHGTQTRRVGATDNLPGPFQADELLMLLEKYIRPVPRSIEASPRL